MSIKVPTADMVVMTSMIELESLFGPLFDEYFNGENQVVLKSSVVTTADASDKRQQQLDSTSSTSTLAIIVIEAKDLELGTRRKLRLRITFVKTNEFHSSETIIMENLPPPNNDLNIPKDEHAPAPKHAPIAPNHAPIQPNDYLANDKADPKEEPEEEEEPIPEQALAAPEDEEEIKDEEDEEMEVKDKDGENNDAEVYNPYEEVDPLNRPPPSPETADREIMNAPVTRNTL
ncbi:hypothetical protein Tco_1036768 [Tanacetum coccineum]